MGGLPAGWGSRANHTVASSVAIDLHALAGMPDKIEGVAVLTKNTRVVANGSDLDIWAGFDGADNNAQSRLCSSR